MINKYGEIVITGFGGQGIVLAGNILGKAASIYDNLYASLTQSYGPEARGGACSAQVVISSGPVLYPYAENPDILIAMSQEGYNKNVDKLKPGGTLIVDCDLVKHEVERRDFDFRAIPATKIAEDLGYKMMANIVIIGFFTSKSKLISKKSIQRAIETSVPAGTYEKNKTAFTSGFNYRDNSVPSSVRN
ncbi:MAG: 2-oxoacid:acceptor oxidoreductase family protein [Thermodesulfobacteriota bacterium]|nr:2-oxoacid:acceptor oxidoreductase family protein [Thermodesulfobacteriota bacterium]